MLRDEKLVREEPSEKPQHRDQSKRVRWHKSINWANDFLVSLKERWFRSVQIIYIKLLGTKFQISELCFPSHCYQQNNKTTTEPGMTQWIPNTWSICTHKKWAIRQKNKEVIHRFLISTTYTTSICQRVTSKHKSIQCNNLAMNCCPHKKKPPF